MRPRRRFLSWLAGLLLALALMPAAHAEVWGYVDEKGVAHFAAEQLDERYELFFRGGESFDTARGLRTPRAVSVPSAPPKLLAFFDISPSYKQVKHHLREASNTHRIDYELLQALIATESGFDAGAVSPKGAVGLMQVMPATAGRYGVTARSQDQRRPQAVRSPHQHHGRQPLSALPARPVPRPARSGAGRLQRRRGRRAARRQQGAELSRDPELREDRDAALRGAQAAVDGVPQAAHRAACAWSCPWAAPWAAATCRRASPRLCPWLWQRRPKSRPAVNDAGRQA